MDVLSQRSNTVRKMDLRNVVIFRISNRFQIQDLCDVQDLDMELVYRELGLPIGLILDGTIRKLSSIIWNELKSRENKLY